MGPFFPHFPPIPAKAGTHPSTIATAGRWVPAVAGMVEMGLIDRQASEAGALAAEGGDAGLGAPEDQGVDVVGALVGVDGFEVHDMADDVEFVVDAVAAMHVARQPRDLQSLAAIVALEH